MNRRQLIAGTAAVLVPTELAALSRSALAQQPGKVWRVAFFWPATLPPERVEAFRQGLLDVGYAEGRNISVQAFAWTDPANIRAVAATVIAGNPDIIVCLSEFEALALQALSSTIPIVFGAGVDPVGAGAAFSVGRPGKTATGLTSSAPEIAGKQLALFREIVPRARRVAILSLPVFASVPTSANQARLAAIELGLDAIVLDLVGPSGLDIARQLEPVAKVSADALFVPTSNYFTVNHEKLAEYQAANRLPLIWSGTSGPRALVGYGPSTVALARKAGSYVDAILKGAKPGDLPIQQPTVFDLSINLTTAKALGITYPTAILAQATIVHE